MSDWKRIKFFDRSEFYCECGCNQEHMNTAFLIMLDQARELADIPFKINSGYRCLNHNRSIGSKDSSSHIKGYAADIDTGDDSRKRFIILRALIVVGFRRIGIGKDFIHVDNDQDKNQKVNWLY